MSTYKSLIESFVTLHVALGNENSEEACAALNPVHEAAYELLERSPELPGQRSVIEDLEVPAYELCADDTAVVEVDGRLSWGVTFYSPSVISNATARALRDAVLAAYREAATQTGHPGLAVDFAQAERQDIVRVTQSQVFDVEAPEPPHPARDTDDSAGQPLTCVRQ